MAEVPDIDEKFGEDLLDLECVQALVSNYRQQNQDWLDGSFLHPAQITSPQNSDGS